MSIDTNKALVKRYFERMNAGDTPQILEALSDDFVFESMLQKPEAFNATWGRDAFAAVPSQMASLMRGPFKIWATSMIAEGDSVAVEARSDGELKTGGRYQNAYHFLFKVRDDKIYHAREYSCSYTAAECFGNFFTDSA